MILMDVNVFVHAFRRDMPDHARYRSWLQGVVGSPQAFGVCDLVLSGFLRVVTHPKIFKQPSSWDEACNFVQVIRERTNCRHVDFGDRHWGIFTDLCRKSAARGNLVPDAHLVALMQQHGISTIWSRDRDLRKFDGITVKDPFADRYDAGFATPPRPPARSARKKPR